MTLAYPPFNLLASPFSSITQDLGSPDRKFPFDANQLATSLSLLNQGSILVTFAAPDGITPLDQNVFTVPLD